MTGFDIVAVFERVCFMLLTFKNFDLPKYFAFIF